MEGEKVLDDGKAEAGASSMAGAGAIHAVEALEDMRLIFASDTNPCIGNTNVYAS